MLFFELRRASKAQGHAKSLKLQLVGYYQACERLDDTALAPVGEKVAGTIRSGFKDAVAFVVCTGLS